MVLLPGDPGRVPVPGRSMGRKGGGGAPSRVPLHARLIPGALPSRACSTGIGGPSTEIAINELAAIGCSTFLRLGTTGGLQEDIRAGDITISTAAIRWEGASDAYAPVPVSCRRLV